MLALRRTTTRSLARSRTSAAISDVALPFFRTDEVVMLRVEPPIFQRFSERRRVQRQGLVTLAFTRKEDDVWAWQDTRTTFMWPTDVCELLAKMEKKGELTLRRRGKAGQHGTKTVYTCAGAEGLEVRLHFVHDDSAEAVVGEARSFQFTPAETYLIRKVLDDSLTYMTGVMQQLQGADPHVEPKVPQLQTDDDGYPIKGR